MKTCNDPKCPLNRQGVPHEIHELIESRQIENQCMDGRCAMNRMGMPHNSHDVEPISESKNRSDHTQVVNQEYEPESFDDALEQIGKNIRGDYKINELSPTNTKSRSGNKQAINEEYEPQSFDDALKHLGKNIKKDYTGAFEDKSRPTPYQTPQEAIKQKQTPRQKEIPEVERILSKKEPHEVFGLSKGASLNEIKQRRRELVKKYNPAQGRANRTSEENKRADEIMKKIILAYSDLKSLHGL